MSYSRNLSLMVTTLELMMGQLLAKQYRTYTYISYQDTGVI
jgi:hypothetical protein